MCHFNKLRNEGIHSHEQNIISYSFLWVILQHLHLDARESPKRKYTTFRTWRKFEIKNKILLNTCRQGKVGFHPVASHVGPEGE